MKGWISNILSRQESLELDDFFENKITQWDEKFEFAAQELERYLEKAAEAIFPGEFVQLRSSVTPAAIAHSIR